MRDCCVRDGHSQPDMEGGLGVLGGHTSESRYLKKRSWAEEEEENDPDRRGEQDGALEVL